MILEYTAPNVTNEFSSTSNLTSMSVQNKQTPGKNMW